MVFTLLQLRLNQVRRVISGVTWYYQIVLLFFLLWAVAGLVIKASQPEGSQSLPVLLALILASVHWMRPDYQFLRNYFENYRVLCLSEYLILSTPLLAGLMFSPSWYLILPYLIFLIGLAYLVKPKRKSAGRARKLKFIPDAYFEWKSGIRKYFYPMAILWLLGLVFSFQMGAAIVVIFLLGLLSLGFYDYCEPVSILIAPQQSATAYLQHRIKGLFLMAGIFYLPLLLLFCIFHPTHWYIPTVLATVMLSYQVYALMIKYAFYAPQTKSSKNTVLLSLGALVLVLPFILPAIWVLTIRLYFQSIKKLSFYLHDFH
ncbi:MAG: hypothetical protein ABJF11_11065 [Reichenbachiella sp.]|uniref:hypothetical protein n=1 Tax=Reichenbachiella sp. TaxID=2184521 RepID=UPI0032656059